MEGHERIRLGKMIHPVRGFMHGTAAVVALIGAILLAVLSDGRSVDRLALLIFGLSMVALFTVSALYHSVPWQEKAKQLMRRLDHTMIHVLIAGSFTPIAIIVFDGWLQWATLGGQWGVVLIGAIQKFGFPDGTGSLSVALTTSQGWLALLIVYPMATHLPAPAVVLYLVGGVLYTIGMVFLVTNRPRLWPRIFSYHEVFHILVVTAAALHYAAAAEYIANYAA